MNNKKKINKQNGIDPTSKRAQPLRANIPKRL